MTHPLQQVEIFYTIVVVKSKQIKSNLFVTQSNEKYGLGW